MATKTAFRRAHRRRGYMAAHRIALSLLAGCILLAGCGRQAQNSATFYAMGTVCTLQIYGSQEILTEAAGLMNELDRKMSWRTEGSDIWTINEKGSAQVDASTAAALEAALEVSRLSGGAFDPTMGIITSKWSFKESPHTPERGTIAKSLALVDYRKVKLEGRTVSLGQGQKLDLGGIAKGYGADQIKELLTEKGVTSGVVNLGGNVYVLGKKPDGSQYQVGVRDPKGDAGSYFCAISVEDKAVVISGPYEQNFEDNGKLYHHLLDPKTGYPAETGLASVCIVADSSTLADGLSTAVFVLGEEEGLALVDALDGVEAMLLNDKGEISYSRGFFQYSPKLSEGTGYVEKG